MGDRLFYDGDCGLCHWAVGFVLPRDRNNVFRFAPLDSDTFRNSVPEAERRTLPDSMVVVTADGRMLMKSSAVIHILDTLGGGWKPLAVAGRVIPSVVRDWLYDRIAASRHRLFRKPTGVCPVVPADLRTRFDS